MPITGDQTKVYVARVLQANLNSFKAFSYQQLTLSNAVQNLTIPDGAKYALITVESTITTICGRYLETKQTAVAIGTGMPFSDGAVFDITDAQNLAGFQVIQEAAGTHKLNIQYYK
tara:strand:+ start:57 stop:404 length:348 start_codon:yes stop_codon:yes gene_type:complete